VTTLESARSFERHAWGATSQAVLLKSQMPDADRCFRGRPRAVVEVRLLTVAANDDQAAAVNQNFIGSGLNPTLKVGVTRTPTPMFAPTPYTLKGGPR
jgi:hypothetical protein